MYDFTKKNCHGFQDNCFILHFVQIGEAGSFGCLLMQFNIITMKNFKNIVKRSPSPKANNNQALSSQRSKNNSQNLLKKYNQTNMEIQKLTSRNKYRIVTEPMDDNMHQGNKSYSKLIRPKQRELKIESQHNSIKSRQKTISHQKRADIDTTACLFCKAYQNQLKAINEQIRRIMEEKDKWKKGLLLLQDFQRLSGKYNQMNTSNLAQSVVEEVRRNVVDLMSDIEALTDVQFPKILSYNIFNPIDCYEAHDQHTQIKSLLRQLREENEGKVTSWDYNVDEQNEYIRAVMRNLKSNLSHYIRENLQLKTKIRLLKKGGNFQDDEIKHIVNQLIKGARK